MEGHVQTQANTADTQASLTQDLLVLMVAPDPKPAIHGQMLIHSVVLGHTLAQRHLLT